MARNVKDYGVQGSFGSEHGTIQGILDNSDTGEEVLFPSSKKDNREYFIDKTIVLSKSVVIRGDSPRVKITMQGNEPVFTISPTGPDQVFILENLEIVGGTKGIFVSSSVKLSPQSRFHNLFIHNFSTNGIEVNSPECTVKVTHTHISGGQTGIFCTASSDLSNFQLDNSFIEHASVAGFRFDRTAGTADSGSISLKDSWFKANVIALSTKDATLSSSGNTYLENTSFTSSTGSGSYVVIGGGAVDLSAVDQDIIPLVDSTYNIGSGSKAWKYTYTDVLRLKGPGAPASPQVGDIWIDSNGAFKFTRQLGSLVLGSTVGPGSHNFTLARSGSLVCGYSKAGSAGSTSTIQASGFGDMAIGATYVYAPVTASVSIGTSGGLNKGNLSFGYGYAYGNNSLAVMSTVGSNGGIVGGYSYSNTYKADIRVSADGGFAHGFAYATTARAYIRASREGAKAFGFADSSDIIAAGAGSFATGYARNGGGILASGKGSLAIGYTNAGFISASANNAFQLGPGVNPQADSLKIGNAGLRLKGTTGAPASLQNGDIWTANSYVYIRSNGVSVKIT